MELSRLSVDPGEILHYLDGVVHRGRYPTATTAWVNSLEAGHHLGHGGSDRDNKLKVFQYFFPQDSPVQVEEGLDKISIDESLTSLVFLLTGERPPVVVVNPTDGFDNFAQSCLELLQELVEILRQLCHETDGSSNTP